MCFSIIPSTEIMFPKKAKFLIIALNNLGLCDYTEITIRLKSETSLLCCTFLGCARSQFLVQAGFVSLS